MKVGIVVVTHSYDMAPLLASVSRTAHEVRWYVHHHGGRNGAARFLRSLGERPDLQVAWHYYNRGLSTSWNDGLKASRDAGNDVTLLVNDDVHFLGPDAFDRFIAFVEARDRANVCFVRGREPSGLTRSQGLACCAIGPDVLDTIGFLDENFFPAYYEDLDYMQRMVLAGIPVHVDERVLVFHQRNGTSKVRRLLRIHLKWHQWRSRRYYRAKWRPVDDWPTAALPFGDARATLRIAWQDRADPYRHLGRRRPLTASLTAALTRWASAPLVLWGAFDQRGGRGGAGRT